MEESEIRRTRLRQWIDDDPVSRGNIEAWCRHYSQFIQDDQQLTPTFIRQLAPRNGKPARNIGEKVARRLEKIGGKPAGWLDRAENASEPATLNLDESPAEKLEHIKKALAHMLKAAGLEEDALILERKNVSAYTPERIKSAVTELMTEISREAPDLTSSQIGDMVVITLQTWIEGRGEQAPGNRDVRHGNEASQ